MEIEDLKRIWEDQGRKLDASLRLNAKLIRESILGKAATAMTWLSRLLLAELLLNLGIGLWLGSFIAEHVAEARFLIPAVVLDLGVIALIIACIHQLVAIKTIDYSAPIVAIQKRLGSLKVQRVRTTMLVLLTAPLVWTPLLIVALKALANVDAYAIFTGAWLAANVAFGAAVIPLAVWLSRRYADRMESSPLGQSLMRDLAGYNLNAAVGFVSSLSQFEQEESPLAAP